MYVLTVGKSSLCLRGIKHKESLTKAEFDFFDRMVDVERIKVGKRQTIDTLISEEALLFAKYVRNEKKEWVPRIVNQIHYDRSS